MNETDSPQVIRTLRRNSQLVSQNVVTFTRIDGRTVEFTNVAVDTISPVGANKECIVMEFIDSNRVVHLPFVQSWEVRYV